jgi:cytochrome c551/c552
MSKVDRLPNGRYGYLASENLRNSRTVRRHVARVIARQRCCATCHQMFTATRGDAAYCSGPCRQQAYRQRVADRVAAQRSSARTIAEYNARLSGCGE